MRLNTCYKLVLILFLLVAGISFSMPAFAVSPGDPCRKRNKDGQYDCKLNCQKQTDIDNWLNNGTCDTKLQCAAFNDDNGDCIWNPGENCAGNKRYTCDGQCKSNNWINSRLGNGICNPKLSCDAYGFDGGDCGVDCYDDYDNDGYGDMYGASTHVPGACPAGSVQNNTDCNDNNPDIYPDAAEVCNSVDDNCNGEYNEGLGYHYYWDYDGDGYGDANDNGFDSCYFSLAQMTSLGYVLQGGDCAPANPAVYPGAAEICGDGIDNDCDPGTPEAGSTVFYKDDDGDGYGAGAGTSPQCFAPAGYVADNSDCDDGDAAVNPGATEVCNGVDDNCNAQVDEGLLTTYYADVDADGYGDPASSTDACSRPAGHVEDNTDCDDADPSAHPGGEEVCDHADNNCDGQVDEGLPANTYYADADGDRYGDPTDTVENCDQPANYVTDNTDCDDNNADYHPGAFDVCGNGIDENCNGPDRVCGTTDSVCANLADIPLETQVESAPPIVMFVVDDSGSMDWDVLCPESNGKFSSNAYYAYTKRYWKSQFSGYNGIYYDPELDYAPWPDSAAATYDDASKDYPKDTPKKTYTRTLNSDFDTSVSSVHIRWSHYYAWSATDQAPYLVNITGSGGSYAIDYYKVGCNGDCLNDHSYITSLTADATPPADVVTSRDATAERQNFANWYQYYRLRQLTAIAALSNVVTAVNGMKIGIHAINDSVSMVAPRLVNTDRGAILDTLYNVGASGGTPLRNGLKDVGNYYDDDTNGPFSDAANGGQCQQAFTIVMTDGYYNGSSPSVGNTDTDGGVDDKSVYDGSPFGDAYSNTLADVAMKYYENDLNATLSDNVPHNAADPAPHQHMVTYTVSFGLTGTLTPSNYDCPAKTCPVWPYVDTNDEHIDDLWHAAVNGRGKFMSAKNSQQLAYALSSMLKDVSARAGVGASVAVNTRKLQENTMIYQGSYNSAGWTGDLKAYAVSAADGTISDTPAWSAADKLDALPMPVSTRNIYTMGASGGTAFTAANLNSLTSVEQQSLGSDAVSRQTMINYLRGDTSNDRNHGGTMRVRITLFGDIIHSAPVHVGDYIYVGANDGMLHAFDATAGATGGQETFAYVPSFAYQDIAELANPDYGHLYFIDNTPFVGNGDSGSILLIGGMGKGGKGYFCLDVTSPATFSASNVKWEYPNSSSSSSEIANMGYSFSQAAIVPTEANGDVVIFGNGYDSPNARAVLYVISKSGVLLEMIDTGYGDTSTNCNGLSTPVFIDPDNNGKANYAYAGDLRGNVWKFDLNGDVSGWHVAFENSAGDPMPLFQARDEYGIPQPITTKLEVRQHCIAGYGGYIVLFGTGKFNSEADFNSGSAQGVYGIWDWAGAWEQAAADLGITVNTTDKYLGAYNSPGVGNLSNVYATMTDVGDQLTLVAQQAGSGELINGDLYRSSSANDIVWFNVKRYLELQNGGTGGPYGANDDEGYDLGWYFPLNSGERVVADPILQMGYVLVVSLKPSSSMCSPGGESFFYALNYCSGAAPEAPIFDINGDGTINSDDTMTSGDVPNSMELNDIYYTPVILVPPNEDDPLDFLVFGPDKTAQMTHQKLGIIFWRFLNID